MSGVAVVRYLLANSAPFIAQIPATRITAGDLPLNIGLPACSVKLISGTPRNTVAMTESPRLHTDRVQVSFLTADEPVGRGYPGIKALQALALTACANQSGTVNGVAVDSILPDVEGPDLTDDASKIRQGSRDFIVKWRG